MCRVFWFLLCFGSGRCFHVISRPPCFDIVAGTGFSRSSCSFGPRCHCSLRLLSCARSAMAGSVSSKQSGRSAKLKKPMRRWTKLWTQGRCECCIALFTVGRKATSNALSVGAIISFVGEKATQVGFQMVVPMVQRTITIVSECTLQHGESNTRTGKKSSKAWKR